MKNKQQDGLFVMIIKEFNHTFLFFIIRKLVTTNFLRNFQANSFLTDSNLRFFHSKPIIIVCRVHSTNSPDSSNATQEE